MSCSGHMGHLILNTLKERPNAICQIDAATGEEETNASVLSRSVNLARSLRRYGLAPGDVLALHGRNHLDLHIPYYAALMNGLPIVGVDPLFKIDDIKALFKLIKPKIAFCDPGRYEIYVKAASDLGLELMVVAFGDGPNSMQEFVKVHAEDLTDIDEFVPAVFDQDKVYAWLVSSGGTTGVLKIAAIKHSSFITKMETILRDVFHIEGTDSIVGANKPVLNLAPVQWISGFFATMAGPLLRQTIIQTSAEATVEHVIDMVNKYKPMAAMIGPSLATGIVRHKKHCDLTCFKQLIITGGKVYSDLLCEVKKRVCKGTPVFEIYGMTESIGPVLAPNPFGPQGNCGVPSKYSPVKLVDPETGREITESNVAGELWTKSERLTEYYNDPVSTANAITEDGWYKTGDLLYHDEKNNYFYVERLKMLIKYRSYHILPPELEEVIRSHNGVLEVSVTSIPHAEDGEHAVACVVRRPGSTVSAQEIKDIVADKLSEVKKLRGGVVFLDSLPMTSAGKVARAKLPQLVLNTHRE